MNTHMAGHKAQIFSVDILFSMTVLIFLLSISLLFSNQLTTETALQEQRQELREATASAANALIKTAGNPGNWTLQNNITAIKSFGLADEPNVLNYQKVASIFMIVNETANYSRVKQVLGLDRPNYNFTLNISYANGTIFNITNSTLPSGNETASSERIVVMNGTVMKVRLSVWIGG